MTSVDAPIALLGCSPAAQLLERDIAAAARTEAKVLITGESGVGKEVAARLIHHHSPRAQQALVAVNCAGVPDTLLESELFGHERGSFTGAYRDKPGILEAAHHGTVFLDEIGEMSLRMQAILLRFLESGEVQRVGADRPSARLNVRVICATNRTLSERIATGEFREDLYYRLNVIRLHLPPLRERREDLPAFLDHFLASFAARNGVDLPALEPLARERLLAYHWPGNVRELKNVLERLVVRARGTITAADLPPEVRNTEPAATLPADAAPPATLADRVARDLYRRLLVGQERFWTVIYEPFMARDLTRDTVRRVVTFGLEQAGGQYDGLRDLFNMSRDEHRRLLVFLRKFDCVVTLAPTGREPGPPSTGRTQRVA
jgi:transcriptional regulator with PAS, ATPase and Fis domain